jgi:hypothetical protein
MERKPDAIPDGYQLQMVGGHVAANTNQFTQMEANMALFMGLATHLWVTVLLPDNTPSTSSWIGIPTSRVHRRGREPTGEPDADLRPTANAIVSVEGRFARFELNCDNLSAGQGAPPLEFTRAPD